MDTVYLQSRVGGKQTCRREIDGRSSSRAEATFGNSVAYGPPNHIDAQHARYISVARGIEQVRPQLACDVPSVHSVVMASSRAGSAVSAKLDIRGAGDG